MDILIYVTSPTNFIASICALDNQHKNKPLNVTVLVWWPGASKKKVNEIAAAVKSLARPFPFVKKISSITNREILLCFFAVSAIRGYEKFRKKLDIEYIDEIYYPHDFNGELCSIICSSFPQAKKVCNGDGLGNYYNKKHSRLRGNSKNKPTPFSIYKNIKKSILIFIKKFFPPEILNESLSIKADRAVAIMPVDFSGDVLKQVPLFICKKESVAEILNKIKSANHDFDEYISIISNKYNGYEKLILLTENYAEARTIDLENEVEMYVQIITDNCLEGSLVILKSHPLEALPRNKMLRKRLEGKYTVVVVDKRFNRFPIETWGDFLCECKIACMSYPVLSLKYLYNIDVIQSLDEKLIEKWFIRNYWDYYKSHIDLFGKPLQNLAGWSGDKILWSGTK